MHYYYYIMRAFVDSMNILGYLAIDTFSTMIATLWTIIDAATKVWRFGAVTIFFRPNNERKSHAAMLIRQVAIKVTSSTSADVYYNFLLIMIGIEEIDGSIIHICDHFKQKQIPSYAPHLCHGALYYSNDRSQFFNERRMLHAPWSRVACLDPMDFAKLSWY